MLFNQKSLYFVDHSSFDSACYQKKNKEDHNNTADLILFIRTIGQSHTSGWKKTVDFVSHQMKQCNTKH